MNQDRAIKSRLLEILIFVLSAGTLLYLVSYAFLLWETPERLVLIFIPAVLVLCVLRSLREGKFLPLSKRYNVIAAALVIALLVYSAYYFYSEFHSLLFERAANNNATDMVLGLALVLIVIVATWKVSGSAIPIVALVFIAYAFLGKYLPPGNVLYTAGIKFPAFIRFAAIGPDGIFGT
ncbi:MAG: hypothetical protein Q7R57_10710, partial [Dehalococcoidales bacterium]|nr:hypothetical protein [Dehalococcoidales bacterium]